MSAAIPIRITGIYPPFLLQYRYAKAKAKDHVTLWIKHLLFSLAGGHAENGESLLVAADGSWKYASVDAPGKILEQLAGLFLTGLEKPLPFFPATSMVYAKAVLLRGRDETYALEKAREKWLGNEFLPGSGEREDEYYQLAFRNTNPLDTAFQDLAIQFYDPLFSALKRIG
ncbi:MAG: hypothetical protein P8Y00_01600 [Deltaproteobacteria bacterium]